MGCGDMERESVESKDFAAQHNERKELKSSVKAVFLQSLAQVSTESRSTLKRQ